MVDFVELLTIVTTFIERAFSAIKFIKNELRSQKNNDFLSNYMVPFIKDYVRIMF